MSNTRKRLLVGACGAASVTALPAYLTALHSEHHHEESHAAAPAAQQVRRTTALIDDATDGYALATIQVAGVARSSRTVGQPVAPRSAGVLRQHPAVG